MIEQKFRGVYQKFLVDPLLKFCGPKITPNNVTYLSGLVGILVIPALALNYIWSAIVLLLVSGYLDTLDGSLARLNCSSSQIGSALDIVMDRLVEWAVVFALYLVDESRAILCFFMLGANLVCITSFLVVGIFTQENSHKSFFYHEGLIERAEAFIFYILMMLLPGYFSILAIIYVILVVLSAFLHLRFFYKWQQDPV